MELRLGWLVEPLMEAMAKSTTSTSRLAGLQDGGGIDAAGVVRVKMNRQPDFLLERLDQRVRGKGPAQARHVLDARKCAPIFSNSRASLT
jgi:hypothetical protein